MHFEQIYLDCLAQASYLIADAGEALVVDPRRDVKVYLDKARELGVEIKHVVSTHVHADFVAGTAELCAVTGAKAWMGARFDGEMDCGKLATGDEIALGNIRVQALETPGHTPESICLLVADTANPGAPGNLLTGDTLFLGDVGRPDLVGARGLSPEEMAGQLFDSLATHIAPLPDDTVVWPGHGAGSACGKNISTARSCTLGKQRRTNWALQEHNRDAFIRQLTEGLAPPPRYFAHAASINRGGASPLGALADVPTLTPQDALAKAGEGGEILDVRSPARYGEGHLPGSINLGLQGQFASWAGTLLDPNGAFILVGDTEDEITEARMRLARVGIEIVEGAVLTTSPAFAQLAKTTPQMTVTAVHTARSRNPGSLQLVDVRRPGEVAGGQPESAVPLTLAELPGMSGLPAGSGLDPSKPTAVICAGGYRSSIAQEFLRRLGFTDLKNTIGGFGAWQQADLPVVVPQQS